MSTGPDMWAGLERVNSVSSSAHLGVFPENFLNNPEKSPPFLYLPFCHRLISFFFFSLRHLLTFPANVLSFYESAYILPKRELYAGTQGELADPEKGPLGL